MFAMLSYIQVVSQPGSARVMGVDQKNATCFGQLTELTKQCWILLINSRYTCISRLSS